MFICCLGLFPFGALSRYIEVDIKADEGVKLQTIVENLQNTPAGLRFVQELMEQGDLLLKNRKGDQLILTQRCTMCVYCCNTSTNRIGCPIHCESQVRKGTCGECCTPCAPLQSWMNNLRNRGIITQENYDEVMNEMRRLSPGYHISKK